MRDNRDRMIHEMHRKKREKSVWRKVVTVLASVVVFCTTYALILPAITMDTQKTMVCTEETASGHVHEANCQAPDGTTVCGYADYVIHTHEKSCYDAEGNLICALAEVKEHTHTDACYQEVQVQAEDGAEQTTEKELICDKPEVIFHEHTDACLDEAGNRICNRQQILRHEHTDACYETEQEKEQQTKEEEKQQLTAEKQPSEEKPEPKAGEQKSEEKPESEAGEQQPEEKLELKTGEQEPEEKPEPKVEEQPSEEKQELEPGEQKSEEKQEPEAGEQQSEEKQKPKEESKAEENPEEENYIFYRAGDAMDTVDISILKINDNANPETLAGAEFSLEVLDGTDWKSVAANISVDNKGKADVKDLQYEQLYRLTETKAPEGYAILPEAVNFKVTKEADGADKIVPCGADGNEVQSWQEQIRLSADDPLQLEIVNRKKPMLPETGGRGTKGIYLLGGIFVLGALLALAIRKRQQSL